jgi:hypothetical protein
MGSGASIMTLLFLIVLLLSPPQIPYQVYGDAIGLEAGDVVRACDTTQCWGIAKIEDYSGYLVYGILCPGDNPDTPNKDGFTDGEEIWIQCDYGRFLAGQWQEGGVRYYPLDCEGGATTTLTPSATSQPRPTATWEPTPQAEYKVWLLIVRREQ